MIILLEILLLALLLFFSAVFSGSETAFFSLAPLHRERLSIQRNPNAQRVLNMLENPSRLLVGILSGNMIVNIAATVLVTAIFNGIYPGRGAEYSVPIMTVLLLMFGEISPKVIAARWNMNFAVKVAPILQALLKILLPIRIIVDKVSLIIGASRLNSEELTETDMHMAIDILRRSEQISSDTIRALMGALELDRIDIMEFAHSIEKCLAVDAETPVREARKLLQKNMDILIVMDGGDIYGIIEPTLLLGVSDEISVRDIAQPTLAVSRNIKSSAFLARTFNSGIRWAIIEDEQGNAIALMGLKWMLHALISEETTGEI